MEQALKTERAGRPRDARLDDAIVAATIELLEERSYNDMSLAAVAERAGTSTTAIYRRWKSKSELVAHAVFRTEGDDVVAETDNIAVDIASMVRWAAEKLARPAALAAVVGILGETRSERVARSTAAAMASKRVIDRLNRAKGRGEIRADVDTRVLASLIAGPVLNEVFAGGAAHVNERWIAELVSIILDGVRPQ